MNCETIYLIMGFLFSTFCLNVHAEGSRDFFVNERGNRAFLESVRSDSGPFNTLGQHFVYARPGEVIATASSAQNIGQGRIRLVSPTGDIYLSKKDNVGRIMDVGEGSFAAEKGGPRVGYQAFEIAVKPGEEGVWSVEFISPLGEFIGVDAMAAVPNIRVTEDWVQDQMEYIAAWDISVRDELDQHWIRGRVFCNVLTFRISAQTMADSEAACYAENYVLTSDGYVYKVYNNGNNGIYFTYFVNNKGFLDASGNALYKSVNSVRKDVPIHSPKLPDMDGQITQKMFYNIPDKEMTAVSKGSIPGGVTWLLTKDRNVKLEAVKLFGVEGVENRFSKMGAHISFTTNWSGPAKFLIRPLTKGKALAKDFVPRVIMTEAVSGENMIFWDALDGAGQEMPIGESYPLEIKIALLEAEIHFPYFDMEINPGGLVVTKVIDGVESGVVSVYWDDSMISTGLSSEVSKPLVNLTGISSLENGHKWGSYKNKRIPGYYDKNDDIGEYSFGNNKGMDTWAFSEETSNVALKVVSVGQVDLQIQSIKANKKTLHFGEEVHYEIKLANIGQTDAEDVFFSCSVPEAFAIVNARFINDCGEESVSSVEGAKFTAALKLPSGCSARYLITVKGSVDIGSSDNVDIALESAILWGKDVLDADFSGLSAEELRMIGQDSSGWLSRIRNSSNNFLLNREVSYGRAVGSDAIIAIRMEATHEDVNKDGYHQAGEVFVCNYVVKNTGKQPLQDIYVRDHQLGEYIALKEFGPLGVGEIHIFTRRYVITADDIFRKLVLHDVEAFGTTASGSLVTDRAAASFDSDLPLRCDLRVELVLGEKGSDNAADAKFYIPNIFTPNGDGVNDRLTIAGAERFDCLLVRVLDRHGKVVYRSDVYKNDWDARELEDGTYYLEAVGRVVGKRDVKKRNYLIVARAIYY